MQKELTMPAIVWKGYISFGLVSFPVRLFSAGRAEAVHFHMVHRKDLSRVKEVWYCAEESKPIVQFVRDTEVESVPAKMSSTRKELDLATELIHQLARPFKPDQFHDTYRENVEKLIEQKKKGQEITTEPKPRRAPVIDLMEALKKSLKSSAAPAKATAAKPARRRKVA
jgi:non-homologous end joining protein Ku